LSIFNKNTIFKSDLPTSLISSLEKLLKTKASNYNIIVNGNECSFFGFKVNGIFLSFPLLDTGVIADKNHEALYSKCKRYRIKTSNFFLNEGFGRQSVKSFFLIDTRDTYNIYLSKLNSKYRSQLKNIKIVFKYYIYERPTREDLDLFYKVYIKRMRKIAAIPMPKSFFNELENSQGVFFSKVLDPLNNCRSVSISIMIKDTLHIIWAASDNKDSSNLFMYRELVNFCCDQKGINYLNIGRATNDSSQYKFKKRIGGLEFPIIENKNYKPFLNRSNLPKNIARLYQISPCFLIELLSRIIYRRVIR